MRTNGKRRLRSRKTDLSFLRSSAEEENHFQRQHNKESVDRSADTHGGKKRRRRKIYVPQYFSKKSKGGKKEIIGGIKGKLTPQKLY